MPFATLLLLLLTNWAQESSAPTDSHFNGSWQHALVASGISFVGTVEPAVFLVRLPCVPSGHHPVGRGIRAAENAGGDAHFQQQEQGVSKCAHRAQGVTGVGRPVGECRGEMVHLFHLEVIPESIEPKFNPDLVRTRSRL